jgi:UDP-glucose 4-epimerase
VWVTLITGGAGYLGRNLARTLADRGERILVLDDLSEPNSSFRSRELDHRGINCIRGTTLDASLVGNLVRNADTVVHFASVVGVERTISRPIETTQNIVGTLNVIGGLGERHSVVFGSSADVYGMHSLLRRGPMRESDPVLFEHALVNRWVYAKVKSLEENLVCNSGARSVVIRFFNTYGPFMDWPAPKRVIPEFLDAVLAGRPMRLSGDGAQTRCFCFYTDTVRGIVAAIDRARGMTASDSLVVNIGAEEEISMRALAALVNRLAGDLGLAGVPVVVGAQDLYSQAFHDGWNRRPDLSVARRALGYSPVVPLRDGLRRTLEAMLPAANGRLPASGDAMTAKQHAPGACEHQQVEAR